MIIISLRFSGGSTGEEHDIAHIASSIVARASGLFFACCVLQSHVPGEARLWGQRRSTLKVRCIFDLTSLEQM